MARIKRQISCIIFLEMSHIALLKDYIDGEMSVKEHNVYIIESELSSHPLKLQRLRFLKADRETRN